MKTNYFSLSTALGLLFFSMPTLAMQIDPVEGDKRIGISTKPIPSSFIYDLKNLEEASKIIAQAGFLTDRARSYFQAFAKCYDRSQFTQYLLDPIKKRDFLLKTDPNKFTLWEYFSNPELIYDCRLRLMSSNPSADQLSKIAMGELGLFCEGDSLDRLYCQNSKQEKMQIVKSDISGTENGLDPDIFDRFLRALQERELQEHINSTHSQADLAQEEESLGQEDKKALLEYTLLRCYDPANYSTVLKLLEKLLETNYKPYFENVSYDLQVNGPLNTNLFDGFFYHVLGVRESEDDQIPYAQEDVKNLFLELKNIGFLKNFNDGIEVYTKEVYDPLKKLRAFNEARQEYITDLVIAEGHKGLPGIECISQYKKNTLTIDISPLYAPDVISDINNEEILKELVSCYKGRLDAIYDTSNIDSLTTLHTNNYLIELLKPGGRLMFRFMNSPLRIQKNREKYFVENHGLKPVYSYTEEYDDYVIALEK